MAQFDTPPYGAHGRAEPTISEAKESGTDALTSFTDVADSFGDALDESLRDRPYATLALVAGIGFLFGAAWRR